MSQSANRSNSTEALLEIGSQFVYNEGCSLSFNRIVDVQEASTGRTKEVKKSARAEQTRNKIFKLGQSMRILQAHVY